VWVRLWESPPMTTMSCSSIESCDAMTAQARTGGHAVVQASTLLSSHASPSRCSQDEPHITEEATDQLGSEETSEPGQALLRVTQPRRKPMPAGGSEDPTGERTGPVN